MAYDRYGYAPYVSQAERKREREREAAKHAKRGKVLSPVAVTGRTIARTFWGKAWCDNLERYSDYANRLPRGRTYVRNGSVFHLEIAPGEVHALVSGSSNYTVKVLVSPLPAARWTAICDDAAGAISSLVELLQGRLSQGVMERLCRPRTGLFPEPAELKLSCSCPDGARLCKHVAAALYGVGARLDAQPELLFRLRAVDETALLARAAVGLTLPDSSPSNERLLVDDDLASLFGLDLGADSELATPAATSAATAKAPPTGRRKPAPAPAAAPPAAAVKTPPAGRRKPAPTAPAEPPPPPKRARQPLGTPTAPAEPPPAPRRARKPLTTPAAPAEPPTAPKRARKPLTTPAAPAEPPTAPKRARKPLATPTAHAGPPTAPAEPPPAPAAKSASQGPPNNEPVRSEPPRSGPRTPLEREELITAVRAALGLGPRPAAVPAELTDRPSPEVGAPTERSPTRGKGAQPRRRS